MKSYEQATLWCVDQFYRAHDNEPTSLGLMTNTVISLVRLSLKMKDVNELIVSNTVSNLVRRGYLERKGGGLYCLPASVYTSLLLLSRRGGEVIPGFAEETATTMLRTRQVHEASLKYWNARKG